MKFIERIGEICEQNNNVEIYLDMDGTIIELLFDIEKSSLIRSTKNIVNRYFKKNLF